MIAAFHLLQFLVELFIRFLNQLHFELFKFQVRLNFLEEGFKAIIYVVILDL